jgi:hypothetical protein
MNATDVLAELTFINEEIAIAEEENDLSLWFRMVTDVKITWNFKIFLGGE